MAGRPALSLRNFDILKWRALTEKGNELFALRHRRNWSDGYLLIKLRAVAREVEAGEVEPQGLDEPTGCPD